METLQVYNIYFVFIKNYIMRWGIPRSIKNHKGYSLFKKGESNYVNNDQLISLMPIFSEAVDKVFG